MAHVTFLRSPYDHTCGDLLPAKKHYPFADEPTLQALERNGCYADSDIPPVRLRDLTTYAKNTRVRVRVRTLNQGTLTREGVIDSGGGVVPLVSLETQVRSTSGGYPTYTPDPINQPFYQPAPTLAPEILAAKQQQAETPPATSAQTTGTPEVAPTQPVPAAPTQSGPLGPQGDPALSTIEEYEYVPYFNWEEYFSGSVDTNSPLVSNGNTTQGQAGV